MADVKELYVHKETTIPLVWTAWDEGGPLTHIYYDCKFTEPFGEFKVDHHYDVIVVDYGTGIVESYKNDGSDIDITVKFKAVSIED